jgi:hypothetical protein
MCGEYFALSAIWPLSGFSEHESSQFSESNRIYTALGAAKQGVTGLGGALWAERREQARVARVVVDWISERLAAA